MNTRVWALGGAVAIAVAIVAVLAAGGSGGAGARGERLDLTLDFFPNADHAGIYAAAANNRFRDARLDVHIHAPSDAATPLKLLAAGHTDLAISYEPEVLRARAAGLPVVAVAALVRVPLTAIVSLPRAGIARPADLRGKRVATAGIDYQSAYLDAILARSGVPRASVTERNVGFGLLPPLVSGRVDAVLGAYWNYEAIDLRLAGRRPRVIRVEQAGVPTYDELVICASERTLRRRPALVRRFLAALRTGTDDLARDPRRALGGLLAANRDLDPRLQRSSVAVTLPFLRPAAGRPYGYMDPVAWSVFTAFMKRSRILAASVAPGRAFTNALLPPG